MPASADLDAMGANLLDPRRRPAVALQAYATASEQFTARPPVTDRSCAGAGREAAGSDSDLESQRAC